MANRWLQRPRCYQKEMVLIAGKFNVTITTGVISAGAKGPGYSVALTSTSSWTITLQDKFNSIVAINAQLLENTAHFTTNGIRVATGYSASGPAAILISMIDNAAAAVVPAFASEIDFIIVARNTSVGL